MAHHRESEAAWHAMAEECATHDRHGRHWYRNKSRKRSEEDDLADTYEHHLKEAHAVRVLLVRRDGP